MAKKKQTVITANRQVGVKNIVFREEQGTVYVEESGYAWACIKTGTLNGYSAYDLKTGFFINRERTVTDLHEFIQKNLQRLVETQKAPWYIEAEAQAEKYRHEHNIEYIAN